MSKITLDDKTRAYLEKEGFKISGFNGSVIRFYILLSLPFIAGAVSVCGNQMAECIGLVFAILYLLSALWYNLSSAIAKKNTIDLAAAYFVTQRYDSTVPLGLNIISILFLLSAFFTAILLFKNSWLYFIPVGIATTTLLISIYNSNIKQAQAAAEIKAKANS